MKLIQGVYNVDTKLAEGDYDFCLCSESKADFVRVELLVGTDNCCCDPNEYSFSLSKADPVCHLSLKDGDRVIINTTLEVKETEIPV